MKGVKREERGNRFLMKSVISTPSDDKLIANTGSTTYTPKKKKTSASTTRDVHTGMPSTLTRTSGSTPSTSIAPVRKRVVIHAPGDESDSDGVTLPNRPGVSRGKRADRRTAIVLAPPGRSDAPETAEERARAEYEAAVDRSRTTLGGHLDTMTFRHNSARQQELEEQYLDWASVVHAKRDKAFGGTYELGENMGAFSASGLLTATYNGSRQFLSSASRSPARNAVVTKLAPAGGSGTQQGEFNNSFDPASIGGAVGGATAWLVDAHLLTAMDREAKLRNMPVFKAIHPMTLAPAPGKVGLRVVEEGGVQFKEYFRITPESDRAARRGDRPLRGAPSKKELSDAAEQKQASILLTQRHLEGKDLSMLLQPFLTGSTNATRRYLASAVELLTPSIVFGESVVASGLAGAGSKFGLDILKMVPGLGQVEIDNLVGGVDKVNIFASEGANPNKRAAQWSDIGNLPSAALHTGKDTIDLLGESAQLSWESVRDGAVKSGGNLKDAGQNIADSARLRGWQVLKVPGNLVAATYNMVDGLAPRDLLFRAVLGNLAASTISPNFGPYVAQVARPGGSLVPLPGEPLNSPANVLQQFSTSAMNDIAWQLRELIPGLKTDVGKSLDKRRDAKLKDIENRDTGMRDRLADHLDAQVADMSRVRDELLEMDVNQDMEMGTSAQINARAHALRTAGLPATLGDFPNRLSRIATLMTQRVSAPPPDQAGLDEQIRTAQQQVRREIDELCELPEHATQLRDTLHIDDLSRETIGNVRTALQNNHFPAAILDPVLAQLQEVSDLLEAHAKTTALRTGKKMPPVVADATV